MAIYKNSEHLYSAMRSLFERVQEEKPYAAETSNAQAKSALSIISVWGEARAVKSASGESVNMNAPYILKLTSLRRARKFPTTSAMIANAMG